MTNDILIITNTSGGLYLFREKLIAALNKYYNIYVLTSNTGRIKELEALGCNIINVDIDRRGKNLIKEVKTILKIGKEIAKLSPVIVITYTIKPNIYGGILCRLFKVPYAVNITGLGSVFQKENLFKKIIVTLYKVALKKATVVFFENEDNLNVFVDNNVLSQKQACLLSGAGVDLDKFDYYPYPYNSAPFKFLFIGRVIKEKGIEELLSATRQLYEEGFNIKLMIVGGCDENYSEMLEQYENDGWLEYYGYQQNVIPYLRDCHCFVLPSYHEGMANTNLEAAASGRPVITSNIPGCKEAVINCESGFLCEPKDTQSLFILMKKLVCMNYNDRQIMGKKGRELMEHCFDKRVVVNDTIQSLNLNIDDLG